MEDKEQLLESLYLQALNEPMDYFPHDTNTFDDDAYWAFFQEQGYNGTGIYWQLVPLLTRKKGHSYKVGDKRLLNELYITEEQWEPVCDSMVRHGLLNRALYKDGFIVSDRVQRNAERYARQTSKARLGAEMTNRKKTER